MAKGIRNMSIEKTILKHPLHESSHRTSNGYKPLNKFDASTNVSNTETNANQKHQQKEASLSSLNNKLSSNSLSSSTTRNMVNSYSTMNGGFARKVSTNSYMTEASSMNVTSSNQISSNQSTGPTSASQRGQHYAANISTAASNNSSSLMAGSKQPLLNLSLLESTNGAQTSPINIVNNHSPQLGCHLMSTQKLNHPVDNGANGASTSSFCMGNVCRNGIGELLASLALMCILSLLMAFLALSFIQRSYSISFSANGVDTQPPSAINSQQQMTNASKQRIQNIQFNQRIVSNAKEYLKVFQISVSLSTLTIALDLCCLFVCCIQFLSIIKLLKTPFGVKRSFEFVKKTSHIRVISIGAFLVSIPIFFTGVILYTFVNFDEIPALITSIIIGMGIIFCGVASVQNVYLWQWEKTKASQDMQLSCQQMHQNHNHHHQHQHAEQETQSHQPLYHIAAHPHQSSSTLAMLSSGQLTGPNLAYPLELSTLV